MLWKKKSKILLINEYVWYNQTNTISSVSEQQNLIKIHKKKLIIKTLKQLSQVVMIIGV